MENTKILLSKDEALVLFDYLYDLDESVFSKSLSLVFSDILCQLEKDLSEPFDKNYKKLLKKAQKKVIDNY